ncbi:diphthamide biosynthesis enzyme Dph2 [Methanocorpusculum sp. MG]|uniref:2-(3-amino-3-carboxypropyl)histidine synthase n=1 Tax=Methanocorpusculum petauri TaxID=3002863 RepID=A0ABT4IFY8_9EURY|nr:diphthamide biosynthesis enzyme Dph2 [Methanocorpusculum petauri]MDE2443796.1 diphthamide biosynthesis enzyme Dph2 [Methanocorpusculum sp.]
MIPLSDLIDDLRSRDAKRVAVQLPEGLKRGTAMLASALRNEGFEVVICGDACWGACDLALDALADADVLVHIGHTPVTQEKNVIYIPFRQDIDPEILLSAVPALECFAKVGLVTTIQHAHQTQEMAGWLQDHGIRAVVGEGSVRTPQPGQVLGCTYAAARSAEADAYLFVGTGVFHAIGVSLATGKPTFALDPYGAGDVQEVSADRLLRKRFVQIEKAKSAKTFGILLSSKSGQCRKELAKRLESLSPDASIILIREVSEMQLRNLGFDAYVNTACPRLALDDQSRFPMPVLSPAEFEIVLGLRSWDDYVIDEIV